MPFRTLRVLLATQSVATCITTLERGNENPTIVRRSASHAVPDAPRPLATQSVATCITTLERGNENFNYRVSL
ncbi:hypothetical protein PLA107_021080 [Pseudomonas amygdali pv. lachrymans str. M301315]|uniref:Uncharacterized protein n=1 Tax=Pseudomonas amygdali pv. lachrymans str. M301315 TaxID=629260 RepID=A0AAD0PUH7_PSEAV|nr:hypothetical protein B5U27_20995 [Pseudomonas amygdali pv. lachrymans]AXH57508.1 hypothetical protein PLA107_021080 [Pseudomonas amygdali pv. lachrymans str. M301315]